MSDRAPGVASEGPADKAPAVTRAIRVLQLLASVEPGMSLSDIARRLQLPKSSTAHLCAALDDGGLISRSELGYELGWGTVELAAAYLRHFDPVREFYRLVAEHPALSEKALQLAVLDDTDVLFVARTSGHQVLGDPLHVGDKLPAARSAVGRALLAQLPVEEVVRRFGNRSLPTANRVPDLRALNALLAAVREQGFAVDEGEVFTQVVCLAMTVPVSPDDRPSLAIGVAVTKPAATPTLRQELVEALSGIATRLTTRDPFPAQPS